MERCALSSQNYLIIKKMKQIGLVVFAIFPMPLVMGGRMDGQKDGRTEG